MTESGQRARDLSPEQLSRLVLQKRKRKAAKAAPGIPRVDRQSPLPLSHAQQRLWFLDRFQPGQATYNVPSIFDLPQGADPEALRRTLETIVHRHEALRTRFVESAGRPLQVIEPPTPFVLPRIDLSGLAEADREATADALVAADSRQGFDLAAGPLLRVRLIERGAGRPSRLLLTIHHIVADEWSLGVLNRELDTGYAAWSRGEAPSFADLEVQFADFAAWQRGRLQGERLQRELDFWKERLETRLEPLELPTDRPRPELMDYAGRTEALRLPLAAAMALRSLSRGGKTPFMVGLAVLQALLARYSGQSRIAIGSPIAGRMRPELEPLIGFFVNTLVHASDLSDDPTFPEHLEKVSEGVLAAFQHQELPFEHLVEALEADRDLSRSPLFQTFFSFQSMGKAGGEAALPRKPVDTKSETTKFDLMVTIAGAGEGYLVALGYRTRLFDATTIQRLGRHFSALLVAAQDHPQTRLSELPYLGADERHQLLVGWNDTAAELPREVDLPSMVAAQVRRSPEAIALAGDEEQISYGELQRRARRLAAQLARRGVSTETPVAVLVRRHPRLITALLGVLEAGGFYVPLDPTSPVERLALQVSDIGADILLSLADPEDAASAATEAALLERLALQVEDAGAGGCRILRVDDLVDEGGEDVGESHLPRPPIDPDQLAYAVFTSGSTGRPKAVGAPHRGVARLVHRSGFADFTPEESFLQLSPVAFDVSKVEIWAPLTTGGRLAFAPSGRPTLEELTATVGRWRITTLWLTAGLFHRLAADHFQRMDSVRLWMTGGEAVSPSRARVALGALGDRQLLNGYGPTEACTFASVHRIREVAEDAATVPIGRPIGNTGTYVLDDALRPVPVGVYGELCLDGKGLTRGYLGQPRRTAAVFVPHPHGGPGERLYRTGDRVRWLADGRLDFQGRRDGQVKIRGYRIELGEIETALAADPRLALAAAAVQATPSGDKRLVAYVVAKDGQEVQVAELRESLSQRLPEPMIPGVIAVVDEIPLKPNGKVDRGALPEIDAGAAGETEFVAPSTELEIFLAEIFAEVLEVEEVGIHDSFFLLGGHSLAAVQVAARIYEELEIELALQTLFQAPTVAALAVEIGRLLLAEGTSS